MEAVSDTFWTKGFSAASLDDLAQAAGVTRPTLYAAFGDKRAMYLGMLAAYEQALERGLAATLSRPLAEGLGAFYEGVVSLHVSGERQRGCPIFCTAVTESVEEPAIREAVARVLATLDRVLEARFVEARAKGEIPADADPVTLARLAAATLHTLAIRARAGTDPAELRALAAGAVRHLA